MSTMKTIIFFAVVLSFLSAVCIADVGTATSYGPPYVPSACYGYDQGQFPSGNLFSAANDAIWDNKAACGRKYRIRCLSATGNKGNPNPCRDKSVVVKIVDYCSSSGCDNGDATFHLSADAFARIAHDARKINIEYEQV